jgi:predicted transcriptional regulator
MIQLEKKQLQQFEILKHVESSPQLNTRLAAAKLGCSVKLAHELLGKMVNRGLLHVSKVHSRRWDYFLTPQGIAEKARLTYEFVHFSMQFYQEARKQSSQVCRDIAEHGHKTVAFIGAGELAEIAYLGVKEWNLELIEVYSDSSDKFMGRETLPYEMIVPTKADVIIVALYNRKQPMTPQYLPPEITKLDKMVWIF